jgi:glutathione synthase
MLDTTDPSKPTIKQVEFNTISSSFSSLSALVSKLHSYLFASIEVPTRSLIKTGAELELPKNDSMESVAKGLAKAWDLYGSQHAIVIMVVQANEGNIFDQRWIEYELGQK